MEQFFNVILLSIVIEGIITYANEWFTNGIKWKQLASVLLGVLIAIAYKADLIALFGITTPIPYVGCALTGILLSRGSNYIFDFIKQIVDKQAG